MPVTQISRGSWGTGDDLRQNGVENGLRASSGSATSDGSPSEILLEAQARQPKIILLNRFFYPDESATSQLLTDLGLELVKQGHPVLVVTGRRPQGGGNAYPRRERHCRIEVHRVRTLFGGSRSMLGRLVQYASFYPGAVIKLLTLAERGDVIVAKTDPPLISVAAMIAARVKGAKLVNWVQDLYPEVAMVLHTPFLSGFLGRVLISLRTRALAFAEADVVIGSTMAECLGKLGISPRKIAVIPNWADETAVVPMSPGASAARRSWGLGPNDFVVGYSGNLGQAHEVETLVGAAVLLRDRHDIRFMFVGGGRQHDRLQSLIQEHGLANIIFKPHQPREQLADSLAAADVHWVSLRPELEGLIVPSKLYGILAAARPVVSVCDEAGEVSRIVREHECGVVVQPGDSEGLANALKELAGDPSYRERLGARAREASDRAFPKASALGAWCRLISGVVQGQPATASPAR